MISIHAPTQGATGDKVLNALALIFQSTLPRKERLECSTMQIKHSIFQSTLPRKERQYMSKITERAVEISIHAPTQGATKITCFNCNFGIFQSTLPRKERHNQRQSYSPHSSFQSTLPRKERQQNCTDFIHENSTLLLNFIPYA